MLPVRSALPGGCSPRSHAHTSAIWCCYRNIPDLRHENLTATTANTVTGAFERTLDATWGKVSTGAFDYKTAVKQAVDSLADDMPMVTYPSGHKDSIEVAARRAVLFTGVNQTPCA